MNVLAIALIFLVLILLTRICLVIFKDNNKKEEIIPIEEIDSETIQEILIPIEENKNTGKVETITETQVNNIYQPVIKNYSNVRFIIKNSDVFDYTPQKQYVNNNYTSNDCKKSKKKSAFDGDGYEDFYT